MGVDRIVCWLLVELSIGCLLVFIVRWLLAGMDFISPSLSLSVQSADATLSSNSLFRILIPHFHTNIILLYIAIIVIVAIIIILIVILIIIRIIIILIVIIKIMLSKVTTDNVKA